MPISPALQAVLDASAAADVPPISEQPIEVARVGAMAFASLGAGPKEELLGVDDRQVPGADGLIPVRVYTPIDTEAALPGVVYLHGGGWVFMGIETHDWICRRLAKESGAVVVSVDYRLAPEHPFPAPLDDCYAATKWVVDHAADFGVDPARVAVAGDSAGGNLSAAVTLRARAAGEPSLVAQVLVYPVTDASFDTDSYAENGKGFMLEGDAMRYFWNAYLGPDGDPDDAYASVLRAADLADLPPALVITAEYDPLRDEGEAYGRRLDGFDVPATVTRYDGVVHGFLGMREIVPEADQAMAEIATFLAQAFA
jgi:acetyl esterase